MFEKVYKFYAETLNDYELIYRHANWQETCLFTASSLLSLLACKVGFEFLLLWVGQFIYAISFIFRRIIKRKYGFKVGWIIDCPELTQMRTGQLKDFLSKVRLIDVNKLDKYNQMIDSELKGQYVVEIALPTGAAAILTVIFSHYVGWIFLNGAGKDFFEATKIFSMLSFIVVIFYLYFAVLFYFFVQLLQIRHRNLKCLKKEIDNIILES